MTHGESVALTLMGLVFIVLAKQIGQGIADWPWSNVTPPQARIAMTFVGITFLLVGALTLAGYL